MKKYDVYLFDFDGTLVDTLSSMEYVFLSALEKCGLKGHKDEVKTFMRQPLPVTFATKGGKKVDFVTFDYWINYFLNTKDIVRQSKLFNDTKETLLKLANKRLTLGIVTSNNSKHVKEILKFLDIDESLFSCIVGNQECKVHKPNPDPILYALSSLKITDYDKVVYIGDALDDMIAASKAKVDKILLDRDNEFLDYKDVKINSLKELEND